MHSISFAVRLFRKQNHVQILSYFATNIKRIVLFCRFLAVQQERQPNSARLLKPPMGDEYASKLVNSDFLTSLIVAEPCREAVHRFGHQAPGIPYPSQQEIATSLYCSTPDAICESAARLLFISVKWARNIPSFVNLPFRDQVILLEEGWRELFIMGAVQWNMPLEVAPLLAAAGMHVDNTPAEKIVATMADIRMLQEISARFRSLQVGEAEFACLKAVVLFKSGELIEFSIRALKRIYCLFYVKFVPFVVIKLMCISQKTWINKKSYRHFTKICIINSPRIISRRNIFYSSFSKKNYIHMSYEM